MVIFVFISSSLSALGMFNYVSILFDFHSHVLRKTDNPTAQSLAIEITYVCYI